MGRHYKEVSEALAKFAAIYARHREMEEQAALLPDDERRILFRAVRYSDTMLPVLRNAGFNTVFFDRNAY